MRSGENSTAKARQMLRDAIGGDETPRRTLTNIPYPSGGVSESYSFSAQPPGTSRDERNMRSFDPHTGRLRGSQRVGLGKFGDGNAISGSKKIAAIASVTREINTYAWSEAVSNRFSVPAEKGSLNCTDIHRDAYGTYYLLGGHGDVQRVNADGGAIDDFDAQHYEGTGDDDELRAETVVVDPFQNVFIATGHKAGATAELNNMIHCYEYRADGSYERAWTVNPGMFVLDMAIYGFDLFVWGVKDNGAAAATYELIRYAEYKLDEPPSVDLNSTFSKTLADGDNHLPSATDLHVGRMAVDTDGSVYATWSRWGPSTPKLVQAGIYKLQPISPTSSEEVWVHHYKGGLEAYATDTPENKRHQGYGLGVLIGPKVDLPADPSHGMTRIWVWGGWNEVTSVSVEQPRIRLVIDDPVEGLLLESSLNLDMQAAAGTPTFGWKTGSTFDNLHMRGAVDDKFRAYIPYRVTDAGSTYSGDMFLAVRYVAATGVASELIEIALSPTATQTGGAIPGVTSVAVPLLQPLYDDATNAKTTDFIMAGGAIGTSGFAVGVNLVSYTATSALREIRTVVFSNGGVWRLNDPGAATQVPKKAGGNAAYSTSMNYIQAASGGGHIYFTDGIDYFTYSAEDNNVIPLRSTNLGEIPKRSRLMEFWRNRLVIARSDRLPGSWHMSRGGDVNDWDQFPQTPDIHQAVSGVTSPAGQCPDIINAIIPYTDDVLWFGCDSSIWQLTGEPTSATFDMVTDEVGMSFGRPFCRDDAGRLWFFGSKGGLYTFNDGLQDVAQGKIRNRLRSIDLGVNYITLTYNYADDGIHIFVCPFGDPTATPTDHYFYDKRTGAFHIDKFGGDADYIEPTSSLVIDGDAGKDRAILIGTGNGHVHRWGSGVDGVIPKSDQKASGATKAIDSYVLIGPIADVHDMSEAALSELAIVLAPNYAGAHIEVFSTDTPDNLGDPVWQGEIHAGRNANQLVRVTGDSIYIRMRNASLDEHWALEKCSAILSYGGQIRSAT